MLTILGNGLLLIWGRIECIEKIQTRDLKITRNIKLPNKYLSCILYLVRRNSSSISKTYIIQLNWFQLDFYFGILFRVLFQLTTVEDCMSCWKNVLCERHFLSFPASSPASTAFALCNKISVGMCSEFSLPNICNLTVCWMW